MIDLFYYTSPNARKIVIALEEMKLEYQVHWTDISAGDQHDPEFRRINPNGKIPAIIDRDGSGGQPIVVFESGAILEYLAAKSGMLLPDDPAQAARVRSWTYWQVANQGPMAGQAGHFLNYAADRGVKDEYAVARYVGEVKRCYQVLDQQLEGREYLAGEFSIADIACFPWTRVSKGHGVDLDDYPNVKGWSERIKGRPSAQVVIPDQRDDAARTFQYSDEQWEALFGSPPPGPATTRDEKP